MKMIMILVFLGIAALVFHLLDGKSLYKAIISISIAVIGIIASVYLGDLIKNTDGPTDTDPAPLSASSSLNSDSGTSIEETVVPGERPSPKPETMDLFEQKCTICSNNGNDEFGHNADTKYTDADGRDDYRYFVFVVGKDSYGYSENRLSRTYAIPAGYNKLAFTVGVNPNKSTDVGSAWLEFYDQNHNQIGKTDPMVYDSPARNYTIDIKGVTRLTIKAVPSDDMKEGSNHSWLDVGYFITLLLSPMEISAS